MQGRLSANRGEHLLVVARLQDRLYLSGSSTLRNVIEM
jgi:hypothetical protein